MDKQIEHITIEKEVVVEQEIVKSRFISYLAPISSEDEAKEYLRNIKKEHPKATHHCSAYCVQDIERSNDDGEPASSAGMPMLQVLRGGNLKGVIAVVVRYYGGTKLGVGGLIRAYGSSVTQAIDAAIILYPQRVHTIALTFDYEYINAVETQCTDYAEVIDRQYENRVVYIIETITPEKVVDLVDLTRGTVLISEVKNEIKYVRG